MTIYLAICDDNIADRKHLERLLEREKDTRLQNNYDVLYIDSFGSEEALMQTPIKYDMFFIDVTAQERNGMDVAKALRRKGIDAPIILCESTVSYTSFVNSPKEIIFIDKPLNAGQISHLVDVALDKSRRKIPLIELRCKNETKFINYTELIKARKKNDYLTEVSLSDGSFMEINDSLKSLERQCSSFECFIKCKNDLVNCLHIDEWADNGFKLSNGDFVKYRLFENNNIIRILCKNLKKP